MALSIATLTGGRTHAIFPLVKKQNKASEVAQKALSPEVAEFADKYVFPEQIDISLSHKRFKEASVIIGALALVAVVACLVMPLNPIAFIIVGVLVLSAVGCEIAGRDQKERNLNNIRDHVRETFEHVKHAEAECNRNVEAQLHGGRTPEHMLLGYQGVQHQLEQVLNSYPVETFEFSQDELLDDVRNNRFFAFCEGYNFPYSIDGIASVEGEFYQQRIIRTYVQNVLGLAEGEEPLEKLASCIEGQSDAAAFKKALHLAAYFKLLGQAYQLTPADIYQNPEWDRDYQINSEVAAYGKMRVDANADFKTGKFPLQFTVGEFLPVSFTDSPPDAEAMLLNTAREFTVNPPDRNGNVKCSIYRYFEPTI